MLANATRLCEAKFGNLYLHEGGALRVVASHNVPRAFAEARRRGRIRPAPGSAFGKLIRTKQTVQTADRAATPPYAEGDPAVVDAVELGGVRKAVREAWLARLGKTEIGLRSKRKATVRRQGSPFFVAKSH